jgi:hypothetical protein
MPGCPHNCRSLVDKWLEMILENWSVLADQEAPTAAPLAAAAAAAVTFRDSQVNANAC